MTKTSDVGLAAGFICSGVPMQEIEFEGRRAIFVFDNDETCHVLENLYFDNKLFVSACQFHDNFKRLMARIKQTNYDS